MRRRYCSARWLNSNPRLLEGAPTSPSPPRRSNVYGSTERLIAEETCGSVWVLGGALITAALFGGAAAAQPAPECARAKMPSEKAICADPEIAEIDAAMSRAYAALKASLPTEQQAGLLADQRHWVGHRDALCSDKQGRNFVRCLRDATEARRRFLTGEPTSGAADAARLPPVFHEAHTDRYEISVAYPRLEGESKAKGLVFDRAVRDLVLGDKVLVEYRELPPAGSVNSYTVSYEIPYLDERLASVVFTTSTYTGGAHPNSARESLIFDLVSGRRLELSDIVTEPARAVEELAARCRRQLAAQATKEGWELFPDADFASVVRDIKSWVRTPSNSCSTPIRSRPMPSGRTNAQ